MPVAEGSCTGKQQLCIGSPDTKVTHEQGDGVRHKDYPDDSFHGQSCMALIGMVEKA